MRHRTCRGAPQGDSMTFNAGLRRTLIATAVVLLAACAH